MEGQYLHDTINHMHDYSFLTTKTVQCFPLSLQSVDYIHRCNSLPASVFSICYRVTNYILKKYFKNTTSLFIN